MAELEHDVVIDPQAAPADQPAGSSEPSEPPPEPSRKELGEKILADKDLDPHDYVRAKNEPEFLEALIDAELERQKAAKKAEAEPDKKADTKADAKAGDDEKSQDGEPKKRGGFQRKIDRLEREKLELEQRLEAERRQREEWMRRAGPTDHQQTAKPAEKTEPKPDDFPTWEAYQEARVQWLVERQVEDRLKQERAQMAEAQRKAALDAAQREYQSRARALIAKGRELYDDFQHVVEEDLILTPWIETELVSAGADGAELAYWLGTHPEEHDRISKLPPVDGLVELRLVRRQLSQQKDAGAGREDNHAGASARQRQQPQPAAPKPIKPLTGGSSQAVKDYNYWSKADPEEYIRARNAGELR